MATSVKTPVTLRVPGDLLEVFDQVGALRGASRQALMLEALEAYAAMSQAGYAMFRVPWMPKPQNTPLQEAVKSATGRKAKPAAIEREGSRRPEAGKPAIEPAASVEGNVYGTQILRVSRENDLDGKTA